MDEEEEYYEPMPRLPSPPVLETPTAREGQVTVTPQEEAMPAPRDVHINTSAASSNIGSDLFGEEAAEELDAPPKKEVPLELIKEVQDLVKKKLMPKDIEGHGVVMEHPEGSDEYIKGTVLQYYEDQDQWTVKFEGHDFEDDGDTKIANREEVVEWFQIYVEQKDDWDEQFAGDDGEEGEEEDNNTNNGEEGGDSDKSQDDIR